MKRLLILTLLLSLVPLAAAKVELRKRPTAVDIVGGGPKPWTLTFGTTVDLTPQLLEVSPERAYFAQGGWVRLLDTMQGVVLGRWHVGPRIVSLKAAGEEQVEVEIAEQEWPWCAPYPSSGECPAMHDRILVGPGVKVPLLQGAYPIMRGVGSTESINQLGPFVFGLTNVKPERARGMLPQAEEMVRRDPYLPWARVAYAHLLTLTGDARASAAWAEVLQSPGGDFTEYLPIAAYLYDHHHDAVAQAAYDRGYKDFLQRGYEPRAFLALFYRVYLFTPNRAPNANLLGLPIEQMERVYRLAPYADFAWVTWQEYANALAAQGRAPDAELWQARARDARQNAPALETAFSLGLDRWFLLVLAALVALVLFVAVVSSRYTRQRAADMEAGRRQWAVPLISNLSYWTTTQRLALLLIVVIGWLAIGVAGRYAGAYTRHSFAPAAVRNGNYVGPNARWHFQHLPTSPERNLLLAIAYQQGGDSRRAEEVYRKLPQFAESWNNLGVMLKRRGQDEPARQAFQRALQVDPQLHEAALNLDGSTPDLWTEMHRQFLPDKPMLAIARAGQLRAAYLGGDKISLYVWSALRGPFWPADAYFPAAYFVRTQQSDRWVRMLAEALGVTLLLFALIMLWRVRRDPVTEAAGPRHWILQLICPGTAAGWNVAGGLVLTAWVACWLMLLLWLLLGSPWVWTTTASWMLRWYTTKPPADALSINPSWFWLAAFMGALFVVNYFVVRDGRARSPMSVPRVFNASIP